MVPVWNSDLLSRPWEDSPAHTIPLLLTCTPWPITTISMALLRPWPNSSSVPHCPLCHARLLCATLPVSDLPASSDSLQTCPPSTFEIMLLACEALTLPAHNFPILPDCLLFQTRRQYLSPGEPGCLRPLKGTSFLSGSVSSPCAFRSIKQGLTYNCVAPGF